jgi:hypothetical protein
VAPVTRTRWQEAEELINIAFFDELMNQYLASKNVTHGKPEVKTTRLRGILTSSAI